MSLHTRKLLEENCDASFIRCFKESYSTVILKMPFVSGFCRERIISLGISEEALSQPIDIVLGQIKFDFRITISLLLESKSPLLPWPLTLNEVFPAIISMFAIE